MTTSFAESKLVLRNEMEDPPRQPALSTITTKMLMAMTGGALFLFVTAHMLGNLQIFLGQESLNAYAHKLKSMPLLLWTARGGLMVVFCVHLGLAIYLRKMNRAARPIAYTFKDPVDATFASRTMLFSGLLIFAFLLYHLLHFTVGVTNPNLQKLVDSRGHHDVYSMVVHSFQNQFVSLTYIAAMLVLGLHLSHAISSMVQTFGWVSGKSRRWTEHLGLVFAGILMLVNISIPVSILLGIVALPAQGVSP